MHGKNQSVVIFFRDCQKRKNGNYEKVNYEPREKLCSPACALGKKLKVPAYEFLKEPLIRKYGEEFYEALDKVAKEIDKKKVNVTRYNYIVKETLRHLLPKAP